MNYVYRLASLKLASEFELPGLTAWEGPADAAADLIFRVGNVPVRLHNADHVAPLFQTRGRSEYLLALPGSARILIRNGREVTIESEAGIDPTGVRALLGGPVQAVLWHQRGLLPLHANVVVINGHAVALAGHSAAGKSTLAAVLMAHGHTMMTDDICVVEARAGADPRVLPGYPRLRLWRDTLDHLGIATEGLSRALFGKEKYFVDCADGAPSSPQRLAAVILLSRRATASDTVALAPLHGFDATVELQRVVHMRRPAHALGRGADVFAALTHLAAGASIWRLNVPDDPAFLDRAAEKVLTAAGA
ncbi:MAG: hypothetical protein QOI12_1542 [Alphaproteobacteria bacterium]|jgi:hypothetical protein|nr:hypothetical protein [Alphaproteobacteria bacterium]